MTWPPQIYCKTVVLKTVSFLPWSRLLWGQCTDNKKIQIPFRTTSLISLWVTKIKQKNQFTLYTRCLIRLSRFNFSFFFLLIQKSLIRAEHFEIYSQSVVGSVDRYYKYYRFLLPKFIAFIREQTNKKSWFEFDLIEYAFYIQICFCFFFEFKL